jgi:hypothetical protein
MKPKKALKKSFHKLILILNHKSLFTQPYSWGSTNLLDSILVVKLFLIELERALEQWDQILFEIAATFSYLLPFHKIFFPYLLIDLLRKYYKIVEV